MSRSSVAQSTVSLLSMHCIAPSLLRARLLHPCFQMTSSAYFISDTHSPLRLIKGFSPLFITWHTRSSRRAPRLRGCIGSFEALPLHKGIAEYALISAFQDHRFREIDESELESLECWYVPSLV